jgi:hypothetical protein
MKGSAEVTPATRERNLSFSAFNLERGICLFHERLSVGNEKTGCKSAPALLIAASKPKASTSVVKGLKRRRQLRAPNGSALISNADSEYMGRDSLRNNSVGSPTTGPHGWCWLQAPEFGLPFALPA